jgi:hypothetical protein
MVMKLPIAKMPAPNVHPTKQPSTHFITSDSSTPGFNNAKPRGNEHAIVAIEGVKNPRVTSLKARTDERLTETVVRAERSKASRMLFMITTTWKM